MGSRSIPRCGSTSIAGRSVAGADDLLRERVKHRPLVRAELDVECRDVLLEPFDALGAGDGHDWNAEPLRLRVDPGQSDLCRCCALRVGDIAHRLYDREIRRTCLACEARVAAPEVLVA